MTSALPSDEMLRAQLLAELAKHAGNISRVAADMGKGRMQIHRWIRRLNINLRSFRGKDFAD